MTTRADRRGLLRRAVLTRQAQPFTLDRFYVYQLPAASQWTGAQVHVLDEVGGAVTCFSDGVNWRRITDRTIASAALPTALSAAGATSGSLNAVVGPYMRSNGAAVGTMVGAMYGAAALDADGAAVATLQTPPKVPADLDTDGASTATMTAAAWLSAALSASGSAVGTAQGSAA
jgi:hypothetical protein